MNKQENVDRMIRIAEYQQAIAEKVNEEWKKISPLPPGLAFGVEQGIVSRMLRRWDENINL